MPIAKPQLSLFTKSGESAIFKRKIRVRETSDAQRQKNKEYHAKNKTERLARRLKVQYGITLDDYKSMREKQLSRCAICNLHESQSYHGRLHVDHDHKNGKFRGLLCHNCNLSIGRMKEDVSNLTRAISYLVRGGSY